MSSAPLRTRLSPARAAVRRAVLRRRRLLSALFAAAAVLAGVRAVAPAPPATESVLTAAHDLPSGTVLGPGDLVTRQLPAGSAPDGLATGNDVVGRTVAAPLRRGEPVTDVRLVGPSLLDGYPGLVAVPVRIPDTGAAALLEVGDRVDLMATDPTGTAPAGSARGRTTHCLLRRLRPDQAGEALVLLIVRRKTARPQCNLKAARKIAVRAKNTEQNRLGQTVTVL